LLYDELVKPTIVLLVLACIACSNNSGERAGQGCALPADCYQGVNASLHGEVMCLTQVSGGYCTHLCQTDSDCCAVQGECKTDLAQVCGPFESSGQRMCFLSCEASVLDGRDGNDYCGSWHSAFICRSTGGGSENRHVCVPNG
jgi:hypothetical protein